ncbi:hypothetical protein [Microbacterium sp. AG238]|uniref:hypothetical protein n=1 Tax=Microbacterium sp. AG238 TaxID=2183994 RepID=UPI000FF08DEC|nr:hypothetical protein [Microbacterium sp. AG238]RKE60009.1 hypothetical protein DEU36_2440 [Microbacterium sp. AG238]
MVPPSSPPSRGHAFATRASAIVGVVPPAALIVFLVGSLILSGGQVSESTRAKWAVAAPYPLFVIPAGVLIALAGASVVLAVVSVATARRDDVPGLRGLIGPGIAAAIAAVLFAGMTPEHGVRTGDMVWDAQWAAAPISALAVVILVVGIAMLSRRSSIGER